MSELESLIAYRNNLVRAGRYNPEIVHEQIEVIDKKIMESRIKKFTRIKTWIQGIGFIAMLLVAGTIVGTIEMGGIL